MITKQGRHPVLFAVAGVALTAVVGAAVSSCNHKDQSAQHSNAVPSSTMVSPPAKATASRPVPTPPRPKPPASTGGAVTGASGAVLPNPQRTPGATNPSVTQADIHSTICVSGWTATIRPSSSYTVAVKNRQLASGYTYRGDTNPRDYEEDHLIPLELGGSPTAEANLWPEPLHVTADAYSKDKIENKLHSMVCASALSLSAARHAIATNWVAAYQRYIGGPASQPSTTHRPAPTTTSRAAPPPPTTAPVPPAGATAICNDGTYSFSQHRQGTCSHHGGVREWL